MESRFSEALAAIDAGDPVNRHGEELRRFAWSQGLRTRALREQFTNAANDLLLEIANSAGTDEAQAAIFREVESRFDEVIDGELSRLSPRHRAIAAQTLKNPNARSTLLKQARANVSQLNLEFISAELGRTLLSKGGFGKAAEQGHVRGLKHMLEGNSVTVPDHFRPRNWHVLNDPDGIVVLSDTCVFGVSEDGKIRSLLGVIESWNEIYLPISKNQILVGQKNTGRPRLNIEEVNRSSAKLAHSYIYASQITSIVPDLIPLIGKGVPVLEREEVADIVRAAWRRDTE